MEIADEIMALSLAEKRELIVEINRQMRQQKATGRCTRIMPVADPEAAVCGIVGVERYDDGKRLDRKNMTVAILMSCYLMDHGMKHRDAGDLVGKDESTIYHYRHLVDTWHELPNVYAEEMRCYNEMKRRLYETD